MQDFRDLQVWQQSHGLALAVYEATRSFPPDERYGLTSQMRRSAVSIPANIAEGRCRKGDKEFSRFLQIAMGSASELEYYFILAGDLKLIDAGQAKDLTQIISDVKRMLTVFIKRLKVSS